MKLKQYGITLRRIESRDIELIRKIRNSETIKQKMIYREHITKNMQQKWFKSIEKDPTSVYYIIIKNRKKVGLINVNNFSIKDKLSEGGIFLFSSKYYNTHIPVIASIIMIKVGLYLLNEKTISVKVLKNNTAAINYNKNLGYIIDNKKENYLSMKLTKESFEKKTERLKKAINNIYGKSNFEFTLEPIDFNLGLFDSYKNYINSFDRYIIRKIEKENYKKFILDV